MDETPTPKRRVNLPTKYAQAAVLVSRGASYRAIAAKLGVSTGTVYAWKQRPDFLMQIDALRTEALESWEAHNLACLRRASRELDRLMKDPAEKFADKVAAARLRGDWAMNWYAVRPLEEARKRMEAKEGKDATP